MLRSFIGIILGSFIGLGNLEYGYNGILWFNWEIKYARICLFVAPLLSSLHY
jgi:hypothetical protein